jgi:hypothetical protein
MNEQFAARSTRKIAAGDCGQIVPDCRRDQNAASAVGERLP